MCLTSIYGSPNWQPGAEPGIDTTAASETISPHLEALRANCDINIIDFSDSNVMSIRADNANLSQVLDEPRNDDLPCRWISVNGLVRCPSRGCVPIGAD